MPPRPDKQLRILHALREGQEREGRLPDLSDLARHFGITYPTLREHLGALETKGLLRFTSRGPGRRPEVCLLKGSPGLAIYGEIAAGLPTGAYAEPEGYLRLPGVGFALRVRGDSMAERIEDGDVVLLSARPPQRSGEICALRIGDDEATLKYLEWEGANPSRYRLRPHNPDYPTLEVAASHVRVDGVFRSLLRGPIVQELMNDGERSR